MNESNREEPMKEEVSNENGKTEKQDEVTYFLLSGDEDFASEPLCR